jgi:hypothetical protein
MGEHFRLTRKRQPITVGCSVRSARIPITKEPIMTKHEQILKALDAFVAQRSGIESGNYGGNVAAFRAEQRSITKDLHDYRTLRSAVGWRTVSDEQWERAFTAYSGRLSCIIRQDGSIALDYCTGQYFPTEYRRAACAVLAALLWSLRRDDMPEDATTTPGVILRTTFKREFGHGIQSRWFS